MGCQMRGSNVRRRRRKYRVGARTVNFASIVLVASALVVVVEITAPSSAPPGVFASAGQTGRPDSPTLPLETTAPAAVRVPGSQVLFGSPVATSLTSTSTSTLALAFGVGAGATLPTLSQSAASANTAALTSAVPAAAQRSHSTAEAAKRSAANVGAPSHGKGAGNSSGNSSVSAKTAVVAASSSPDLSPNVPVGGGNGNAGNGANGHANGPSLRSQVTGPVQPDPLVPTPAAASAPHGRGAAVGHRSH